VPPELIEVSEASSPVSDRGHRTPPLGIKSLAPRLGLIGRTRSQGLIEAGSITPTAAMSASAASLTRPSSPLPKIWNLALGLGLGLNLSPPNSSRRSSPAMSPMRSPGLGGGLLCSSCHRLVSPNVQSRSPSNLTLHQLSPSTRSPEPSASPRRGSSPVPGFRRTLMSFLVVGDVVFDQLFFCCVPLRFPRC
jgi:hypothetical protein